MFGRVKLKAVFSHVTEVKLERESCWNRAPVTKVEGALTASLTF
jgi:hypothetical protein